MEQGQPHTKERPSSRMLEDLLHQAPPECFSLGWLILTLHQRSFGIVLLFLGVLATTPIGSTIPALMLAGVALQMIPGRRELVFPQFITTLSLPTHYLFWVCGQPRFWTILNSIYARARRRPCVTMFGFSRQGR